MKPHNLRKHLDLTPAFDEFDEEKRISPPKTKILASIFNTPEIKGKFAPFQQKNTD